MGLACKCRQSMLARRGGTIISNPIMEIMDSLPEPKLVKKTPRKTPKKKPTKKALASKTKKQKTKDLTGEGKSRTEIIVDLLDRGIPNNMVEIFMASKKPAGWNQSLAKAFTVYEDWLKVYREEEKKEEKKEEKERDDDEKAPPPPPPKPPKPVRGAFRMIEKEFGLLRNTQNPRNNWRQVLKAFITEMSITDFAQVPGNFIKEVNALNLKGEATEEQIDALIGIINAYRPSVAPISNKSKTDVELPKAKPIVKKPKKKVVRTISNKVEVKTKPVKRRVATSSRKKPKVAPKREKHTAEASGRVSVMKKTKGGALKEIQLVM